ncbi:MAG: hypothetical protein ACE5FS_01680, partial [Paracoccaceae bacterium]
MIGLSHVPRVSRDGLREIAADASRRLSASGVGANAPPTYLASTRYGGLVATRPALAAANFKGLAALPLR